MRIYELAKKYNVSSKELLAILRDKGFELSSHMAVASDDVLDYAATLYTPRAQQEKVRREAKSDSVKEVGTPVKEKVVEPVLVKNVKPESSRSPMRTAQDEEAASILNYQIESQMGGGSGSGGRFLQRKGVRFSPAVGKVQQRRRGRKRKRSRNEGRLLNEELAPVSAIVLEKDLLVFEVAELLGKSTSEIILQLLKQGLVCGKNNLVPIDVISQLASLYEIDVTRKDQNSMSSDGESVRHAVADDSQTAVSRWPIVVVMGHVDHGKTTLLDFVRNMNVAGGEKGGITQHLGAYEVDSTHGKIVFLDTPGHEAFSYIRQRGTKITDIAVLVVAADDGVKPQTVEAIKHAQQANVPIVVAINKIDKVASSTGLETIKRQLAQHGLMPEDWGGQTVCVPISAKTGEGVEELLEMIVLQSQLMELKGEPDVPARAFILESHQERGLGPVATVICAEGVIKVGDFFSCGQATGKVRLLVNSLGNRIQKAGPSIPVKVVGFDTFVSIGDWLEVIPQAAYFKKKSVRPTRESIQQDKGTFGVSSLSSSVDSGKHINIIVKADTRGSYEALSSAIDRLVKKHKDIQCPIIIVSGGVGDITESDVELALNTGSIMLGLHVRAEKKALILAKDKDKTVNMYNIIYNLIDDLEKLLVSKKEVVKTWKKIGKAVVRRVFKMKGVGVIAGCYMTEGTLNRQCKVVCVRDGQEIGEGKITSLQREKKHVKEVHAGFECGFLTDTFHDWEEGDAVVCLSEVVDQAV